MYRDDARDVGHATFVYMVGLCLAATGVWLGWGPLPALCFLALTTGVSLMLLAVTVVVYFGLLNARALWK